jgi:hypothetical protein
MDWIKDLVTYVIKLLDELVRSLMEIIHKLTDMLRDLVEAIMAKKKKRATHIVVKEDGHELEEGEMGKPLSNTDVRRLVLVPKNDKEKVDSIQKGTMKAMSEDESVATVALDPQDELQALITPADGAQSPEAKFRFTADADMGEGVSEIQGTYSCPIVDQMATIIQVEEGEDLPKEPTPTPVKKKP